LNLLKASKQKQRLERGVLSKHILIDSNNLAMITFNSLSREMDIEESGKDIVYGFMNRILNFAEFFKTNSFVFFFDSKKSYRKEVYSEYKANRKPKNKEEKKRLMVAYKWIKELKEIIQQLGFNFFIQDGYESDDLIAEFCNIYSDENKIIISSDSDLSQLINNTTKRYCLSANVIYNKRKFFAKYGYYPLDVIKIKTIAGDSSDNIKGSENVGEKTALKFLKGELNKKIKAYKTILKDKTIHKRNYRLIKLPYAFGKEKIKELEYFETSFDIGDFDGLFKYYGYNLSKNELIRWENFCNGSFS